MTVDIGDVLVEGYERTTARNGLLLIAAFYVVGLPSALVSAELEYRLGAGPGRVVSPVELSLPALVGLSAVVWLASTILFVGAARTFVGEDTETVDASAFTRNLAWVLLNLIAGGLVYGLLVGVGLLFLVIPGIFFAVSFFFYNYAVVVEGHNFAAALQWSWELTDGDRIQLAVLGLAVGFVTFVLNALFGIPAATLPAYAAVAVRQIGTAAGNVFLYATAARTYVRLTGGYGETSPPPDAGGERRPADHAVE